MRGSALGPAGGGTGGEQVHGKGSSICPEWVGVFVRSIVAMACVVGVGTVAYLSVAEFSAEL